MKKVSIIGAGMVGATAARNIAAMNIVDKVVLLDIKEGVAEGKAMDISQAGHILGYNTEVIGVTNNYEATKNSDVIVVTSGVPRKPGMTREELVGINSKVVTAVVNNAKGYSPNAIYLIVSNPMDTMVVATIKALYATNWNDYPNVIGMGGVLDSARFAYYIQKALEDKEVYVNINDITCYVVGAHSDTNMIPVVQTAFVNYEGIQIPIKNFFDEDELKDIVEKTKKGGATLTGLIGTSAWEAPAAGIAVMIKSIINNELKWFPCSVYNSHYGASIGLRNQIGELGTNCTINEIDVHTDLDSAVVAVKKVNEAL